MHVSHPNENGVLEAGQREIVARHGRGYAAIKIALCEDGMFRYGLDMNYSQGGFVCPITLADEGFSSVSEARLAAITALLRHWHSPFPSEPASVCDELRIMREHIEAHLAQPSLF